MSKKDRLVQNTKVVFYIVDFEGHGYYAADQKGSYDWVYTRDPLLANRYKTHKGAAQRGYDSHDNFRVLKVEEHVKAHIEINHEWDSHGKRHQRKQAALGPPEKITLAQLMGA